MRERKRIVEEYHKGDFEKRLYLFLEYRSLRDEFLKIDRSESRPELRLNKFCWSK